MTAALATPFTIASDLLPVRLILEWGEARAGALFLRDTHAATGEPESLGARLNEEGVRFVPFSCHGAVELVHLAAIACVEHQGELPEIARLVELGARREPVTIELMTGEVLRGDLLAYAPPDRSRLSDLLNRVDRFFPLVSAGRTVYLHREAVATVRSAGAAARSERRAVGAEPSF